MYTKFKNRQMDHILAINDINLIYINISFCSNNYILYSIKFKKNLKKLFKIVFKYIK